MSSVAGIIADVLWLYLLVLIARLVFDIVQMLASFTGQQPEVG